MRIYNLHQKLLVPQSFRTGHPYILIRNAYLQFTTHDIRTYCLEARIYNLHKKILVPQRIHTGNTSVLFTEAIFIYIGRCKCLFITKRKGNIHWNVRDLHRKICVPQRIQTGNTSVLFTEEIFITSAYPHSESTCARSSCKARLPGNY